VEGLGGGGFTYRGTGFAVPMTIETVHEKLLEVWVAFSDGHEDRLDFGGIDLPIREGHNVALLMSGRSIWAVRNLSTGMTNTFVSVEQLSGPQPRFNRYGLILTIVVISFATTAVGNAVWNLLGLGATSVAQNWWDISTGLGIVVGPLIFLPYHSRRKRAWALRSAEATAVVSKALEDLAQAARASAKS